MGAIEIPRYKIKELGVCWTDSFKKIFGYQRWESVKGLQWYVRELPVEFIYDLYRWKFLTNRLLSDDVCMLLDISNLQYGYVSKLASMYDEHAMSKQDKTNRIENYFTDLVFA